MRNQQPLRATSIAISVSDSADLGVLGLTSEHLRDAMAEIARHLLSLGGRLVYGGDLRADGFSELLFELVARHRPDSLDLGTGVGVISYLPWPVHKTMSAKELARRQSDLSGVAELVCLGPDGTRLSFSDRAHRSRAKPTKDDWASGLTAMRRVILHQTQARIVLGGRVKNYKGIMPGIAEEALLSLQHRQPLFVIGGFGGCSRDIADTLGLRVPYPSKPTLWEGKEAFVRFDSDALHNQLTDEENDIVAHTSHIDQAIALILRGLLRLAGSKQ